MNGAAKFTVRPDFFSSLARVAAVFGKSLPEAFRWQVGMLCGELMKSTPPFSGKLIAKMVAARPVTARGTKPVLNDSQVEGLSALAVGKRRVEKDIRRVIFGIEGASLSARQQAMSKSTAGIEGGTLQKCEGKQAIRVFATKRGEVYGVDLMSFRPDAQLAELQALHERQRGARGRVSLAGMKDRRIGRWHWMETIVTLERSVAAYVKSKCRNVGQARGGWADGYIQMGGRLSPRGWVGYHRRWGGCDHNLDSVEAWTKPRVHIENRSAWANAGDPDRVIERCIAERERAMEASILHELEEAWKEAWRK